MKTRVGRLCASSCKIYDWIASLLFPGQSFVHNSVALVLFKSVV